MPTRVIALPAFSDNYIWLLQNGSEALVVDPGDARPVLSYLQANQLTLSTILITHRHYDHINGIADLKRDYDCKVYAPAFDGCPDYAEKVREGDKIDWLELQFSVWHTPGRTHEHVTYITNIKSDSYNLAPWVFCGDTLFSMGCGRVMTADGGSMEDLYASLTKLSTLPPSSLVFCTHEYTESNLRFAIKNEPERLKLRQFLDMVQHKRNSGLSSLPSSLEVELDLNPFLRCKDISQFTQLREWKNTF